MLLGELHDFGADVSAIDELLPAADRAIEWIEKFGDRDDDGFVEYQRATDRGLMNQGWKDSYDGINFAGGRIAEAPIALCEVQGYVYAAYRARARIARARGDEATATRCADRRDSSPRGVQRALLPRGPRVSRGRARRREAADRLADFERWPLPVDRGRRRRQGGADRQAAHVDGDVLGLGHSHARVEHGGAYNPVSYHNGSVWPHDNTICAAGLMRYGFTAEAQAVALSIFETSALFDARLPELFCGFGREEFAAPVGYPTSCSPQSWAAATPFSLLRTLLSFDPDINERRIYLKPTIPESLGAVRIEQVPVGNQRVTIEARGDSAEVSGLDGDLQLVQSRRPEQTR